MKVVTNTTYVTKAGSVAPNTEIDVENKEGQRLLAIGAARKPEKARPAPASLDPEGGKGGEGGGPGEGGKGGK